VGAAFLLVTAIQFHLPFYSSRTLPNIFALALANLAHAEWLAGRRPHRTILYLAFAVVRISGKCCHMSVGSFVSPSIA